VSTCGTRAGYQRHGNYGEKACDACRKANTVFMAEYRRKVKEATYLRPARRFVSKQAAHPLIDRNGIWWAIFPFAWCPRCGAERPCAGPYCQSCGYDVEAAS
jgi:hypothetical protein